MKKWPYISNAKKRRLATWKLDEIVFYDNNDKGEGARTFFNTMSDFHLIDAFIPNFNTEDFVLGKPLAPSIKIRGKGLRRYDFIYATQEKFIVAKSE